METITVKTTDELLALLDENGIINAPGDLHIQCYIPFDEVGERIKGFNCGGTLWFEVNLCYNP